MNRAIRELQEQSTWVLFGLGLITIGVYTALYTRRQTLRLNQCLAGGDQIPLLIPNTLVGLCLAGLVLSVSSMEFEEGHVIGSANDVIGAFAWVCSILWGFAARKRMNGLLFSEPGQSTWFDGTGTFLFSPLYFNYKINFLAKEQPGIALAHIQAVSGDRPKVLLYLGLVLYWIGCAAAVLCVSAGVAMVWSDVDGWANVPIGSAMGAVAWVIGRAARYIVKGD